MFVQMKERSLLTNLINGSQRVEINQEESKQENLSQLWKSGTCGENLLEEDK